MKYFIQTNILILFFIVNSPFISITQETNYWFHNYGSESFLKGGIEVGGVRSTSAVYYNPGALAFLNGAFFEAQADVISLDYFFIENGAGDPISINVLHVDASPSFFAYSRNLKKAPKFTYALSIITKSFSNISFSVDHEELGNFMLPSSEIEVFHGNYDYYNRARENWATGALAYKIGEKVGIGLAANLVLKTQDFFRVYNGETFPKSEYDMGGLVFSKMAIVNQSQRFNLRSLGFIFKSGINVDYDHLKIGLTFSTPNLSLGLLRNRATRRENAILPDVSDDAFYEAATLDFFSGVYKTPWNIELGAEYFFEKWTLAAAVSWFSAVDKYRMVEPKFNSITFQNLPTNDPFYAHPNMAHKSVVNAGIAITTQIKDNFYYAGSLRTDFNYFDEQALDRQTDFVPNMTYWDVFHLTSGIVWSGPRTELSLGINYGFGFSSGDLQIVNMSNPTQQNLLKGELNNNTNTQYANIGFVLGLNYSIDRIKGLKEKKL